jgi:hypothetical protein
VLRGLRLHREARRGHRGSHSALAGGWPKCAKWTNKRPPLACILLFPPSGADQPSDVFRVGDASS